ncbi:hypothetical protein RND81_04G162000 [Saponaria officinalis]|uniref:Uncharacterized protein n=1 Tax=Saponaria officinalis TaxID=3572 RepID=A0AAW1LMQ0_SAPOF
MENKKQQKGSSSSSSSSLTSQLFGPPESDILASIFPPSKRVGRNYYAFSEARGSWHQKESSESDNHKSSTKHDGPTNKDRSYIYQQEGAEPSYLSSSLYYGGQEMYSRSTTHSTSYLYPKFKKNDKEDDPSSASRGNWWQGSLYY